MFLFGFVSLTLSKTNCYLKLSSVQWCLMSQILHLSLVLEERILILDSACYSLWLLQIAVFGSALKLQVPLNSFSFSPIWNLPDLTLFILYSFVFEFDGSMIVKLESLFSNLSPLILVKIFIFHPRFNLSPPCQKPFSLKYYYFLVVNISFKVQKVWVWFIK